MQKKFKLNRLSYTILLALGIVIVSIYATTLNTYFLSETFLLIGHLISIEPLQNLGYTFTRPFFDAYHLGYYRPLLNLLLSLEYELWGINPLLYRLTNLTIHIANAFFVVCLFNELTHHKKPLSGYLAGFLFALYPLHPNAVIQVAAGGNIRATFFMLISLLVFLQYRTNLKWWLLALSLISFSLALCTYEAAIVLPALLILFDITINRDNWQIKQRLSAYIPFFLVLLIFFVVYYLLFGSLVGGGLLNPVKHVIKSILIFPVTLLKMLYPVYHAEGQSALPGLLFFSVSVVLFISSKRWVGDRNTLFVLMFSLAWILFCQFVSLAQIVFPYEGRYWYLGSIGLCIGIVTLLSPSALSWRSIAAWAAMMILVGSYFFLLRENLYYHRIAGQTTRTIQQQIVEIDSANDEETLFFLTDYPTFTKKGKVPFVLTFKWGLYNALQPPFTEKPISVYPVPYSSIEFQDCPYLRWQAQTEQIQVIKPEDTIVSRPKIQILYPQQDVLLSFKQENLQLIFKPESYDYFRVTLLTTVNPFIFYLDRSQAIAYREEGFNEETITFASLQQSANPGELLMIVQLPTALIQDVYSLHKETFFCFIEAMNTDHEVVANTPLMRFTNNVQP